jgi:DNA-binding NtrC family response regulator/tetratricopeptide (TPR) repeat protein
MESVPWILGESPAIEAVRAMIRKLLMRQQTGRRLPTILIQGETGTGKGLVAQVIHRQGPRATAPFVDVNCAAIPENLLEAELFGFERGAFTDARRSKPGLFQTAHRGTIFLDEIGLLPESLQAKLLKAIEEQAVRRLGSTRSEAVDVGILSATNSDLATLIRERRFRDDLYHRLAVFTLELPPLRDRGRDVVLLARQFLARACADYGLGDKRLHPEAEARLLAYHWPGNVRELSNVIERVALLSEGPIVSPDLLEIPGAAATTPAPGSAAPPAPAPAARGSLDDAMREHLRATLERTAWNISRSAALLGISRNTLRARIARLNLRASAGAPAPRPEGAPVERAEPAPPPAGLEAAEPPTGPLPALAPSAAAIRWERRRITLMRITLVAGDQRGTAFDSVRAIDTLIEKVQTFGGRIEALRQAGIEASFGVDPIEDGPRRAVHAATAVMKAVERIRDTGYEDLGIHVAVHAGPFMVGYGGGLARIDEDGKREAATALDALMSVSTPGTIVVSQAAATALERRFDLLPLGSPAAMPWSAYRLAGRERHGLSPGGRMATFVGRAQEMAVLRSRLDAAQRGRGQVVTITGDAGIGKSRLLFEFRQSLAGQPIVCVEGHCLSYGTSTPYLPVLAIVRAGFRISEADDAEAVAAKIRRGLERIGMAPDTHAPYLLHLLGFKSGTEALEGLPPDTIKTHTFDLIRRMSLASSAQQPLIFIIEDLHWVDRTSEEVFSAMVDSVAGARILFVATHRPGYDVPWINRSFSTQLALAPLSDEESLALARSVAAAGPLEEPLARVILRKAEGNPFFLEELTLAVQAPAGTETVPDTIQGVLLARIEHLGPAEQHVLRAAAVIGKDVPLSILSAVLGIADEALRRHLGALTAAEFLYEVGGPGEVKYTFKHALTHEVAYGSLPPEQRTALHARIAAAMETLYADRLDEQTERLALHTFQGQAWDKALAYLRQAGARAFARSATGEAAAYLEQALTALERLPDGPGRVAVAIDLRFDLRTALLPLAALDRILVYLHEAEALAASLGDEPRLAQVWVYLTGHFYLAGHYDRATGYGERALATAERLGESQIGISARTYLGQVALARGQYGRAAGLFRQNLEFLVGDRIFERYGLPQLPSVHSRVCLIWTLVELGEFSEAIALGEEALRIADSVDQSLSRAVAGAGLGVVLLRQGRAGLAAGALGQALHLIEDAGIALWFPRVAAALALAYALEGRVAQAASLGTEAVARASALRVLGGHSLLLGWLGEAQLLAGDVEGAGRSAQEALDLARAHHEGGYEAWAWRLLGDVSLRQGPAGGDQARAQYERGLALAEELGMRPVAGHCHLGLGRLALGEGKPGARDHLSAALSVFATLEMARWAALARAEIERLG